MNGREFLLAVFGRIGVKGEGGPGLVWVQVEEGVTLAADEVVAARGRPPAMPMDCG